MDPRQCTIPASQLDYTLPAIIWTNLAQLQPGRRLVSPQLQGALQLIAAFRRSPMFGLADLRQMDVSAPGVIQATTAQGTQITFGLDEQERQLRRWRQIYDWGFQQHKIIATLDLALENDIPVNWVVASAAPPTNSKPVKPSKFRRKNV
jgi:hypothetical protein